MTTTVTPFFLEGARGRLFALHVSAPEPRGHVVYLPPFCEEMNRCRHLAAAQARRLAAAGLSCLVLDPFGTGDSEGELCDASWAGWRDDALAAVRWCRAQHDLPVTLWGLRLGGMLALDLASLLPGEFERLLLWQPVTNGRTYLTQVLRARIAYLAGAGLPPETTGEIRERLAAGHTVEVAGYVLGDELAADIDRLAVDDLAGPSGLPIDWLHQVARPTEAPPPAVQKVVDLLATRGNTVSVSLFEAPQFWQLSERADAAGLLDATDAVAVATT